MPEQIRSRVIFRAASIGLVALALLVFATPLPFSAIHKNAPGTAIAYWLSESGGKYGTAIILVVTCLFFTRFAGGVKRAKFWVFLGTLAKLLLLIGLLAYANEHGIKHVLKCPRPCHEYVTARSDGKLGITEFYDADESARGALLQGVYDQQADHFSHIDPRILHHWVEESGYSFPSGHSFNGFLLAFILSFCLRFSRSHTARKYYLVPIVWGVLVGASRVAVGAHTAWDVSLGAAMGVGIAFLLMHFDLLRKNILHRDHEKPVP